MREAYCRECGCWTPTHTVDGVPGPPLLFCGACGLYRDEPPLWVAYLLATGLALALLAGALAWAALPG